jgi:hypothetical protein
MSMLSSSTALNETDDTDDDNDDGEDRSKDADDDEEEEGEPLALVRDSGPAVPTEFGIGGVCGMPCRRATGCCKRDEDKVTDADDGIEDGAPVAEEEDNDVDEEETALAIVEPGRISLLQS